jgi:hypothetical protein
VSVELSGLLIANAAYLAVGAAALAALGWLTWPRLGVAFPLGIVLVAVPASYVALLGVPVGATALVVGLAIGCAGLWRTRPWANRIRSPRFSRAGLGGLVALALAGLLAVLLAYAARTFAIRPLIDWDAFAVWTAKARLLYTDPSIAPAALRSGDYGQTPYPLGLPTVEALGFGAMGRFDPTLIGVQFVLLAIAFPIALWSLLRTHARSWVIALAGVGVVGAPQILFQLLTHYADVPLGLFVGLGVAAGAAWLAGRGETWLMLCFAAFLGMAGITKSEGFLFALAGVVAIVAATLSRRDRTRWRGCVIGAGGVLASILPWRIYCSAYGLTTPDYNLARVVDVGYLHAHDDRLRPVVAELWRQLSDTSKWAWLTWVIVLAFAAALAAGRWHVLAFAVVWLGLSTLGLVVLYWGSNLMLASNLDNTSFRTIVSLLIGGAALVPLLVFPKAEDE